MNWISIKEQRPPEGIDVLVYVNGFCLVSRYGKKYNYGKEGWDPGCCGCDVSSLKRATHWSALDVPEEFR